MNKKEIISYLNELNIDKEKVEITEESSLVLLGFKRKCDFITIYTKETNLKKLENDLLKVEIRELDKELEAYEEYKIQRLEDTYIVFEEKGIDKKILKKIKLALDSKDTYKYERELKNKGIKLIAGVDEVGRGPLVGPVVTACVILPDDFNLDGLTDSKKLSEKKRDFYYEEIKRQAIGIGVGICSPEEIDKYNIYEATKIAMKRAIENCNPKPEHILIDAMKLDLDIPTTSIIKGDLLSITISAASVIAKVTRDEMMYELDKEFPMYGFKDNVGYPTKKHVEAIEKYGILKEHRKTFGQVKDYILEHGDITIN